MALCNKKSLWEKLQDKFIIDDNYCWVWQGMNAKGYGRLFIREENHSTVVAHKVMYELLMGLVPEGLELDHLCRNRACINPNHLEPVTHLENLLRSPITNSGKTHCKNGHEFTPNNIYRHPQRGSRLCKSCQKEHSKEYRKRLAWL